MKFPFNNIIWVWCTVVSSKQQLTAKFSAIYSFLRSSLALGRLAGFLSNILKQNRHPQ